MRARSVLAACAAAALLLAATRAFAAPPSNEHFQRTWARTDQPVAAGQVSRTWMWGPDAFTGPLEEPYAEAPGQTRDVQYYDKSRMEINDPAGDPQSPFFVTNGLLVVELMSGRLQRGNDVFEQYLPARVNVAGDADDPSGVTYAILATLRGAAPAGDGAPLTKRLDAAGVVTDDMALVSQGVTAAYRVSVPGIDHQVASPFWALMNAAGTVYVDDAYVTEPLFENPFYATGYPVTEAYWTVVLVGGTPRLVLLQCFERRCLTFTPGNPPGWEVEAGNVGRHYHYWRYVEIPSHGSPTATATGTVVGTGVPTPTGTATSPASPTPDTPTEYRSLAAWGGSWDPTTALTQPTDIAIGPGGVIYVVDSGNARIQMYDPDGVYLGAWGEAGDGDAQFGRPVGIAIYDDVVYVTDHERDRVLAFTLAGEYLTGWGESGNGNGQLDGPIGIAVGANGVYVVDLGNSRVQGFTPGGVYQGQTLPGVLDQPGDIVLDSLGNFYVTDMAAQRVAKFSAFGALLGSWGEEGHGPGKFVGPIGIAVDGEDTLYVVDVGNNRVQLFDTNGTYIIEWTDIASPPGEGSGARSIAVGDDAAYVTDFTGVIHHFLLNGFLVQSWPDNRVGHFAGPLGLDVRSSHVIYIADSGLDRIQAYDRSGFYVGGWGTSGDGSAEGELSRPVDVAISADERVFVVDAGNNRIVTYSEVGEELSAWGGPGAGHGTFDDPTALAIAPDGTLFVADGGINLIQAFDLEGAFLFEWGEPGSDPGAFDYPTGIAVASNLVYVVDSNNNRVQAFTLAGIYQFQWGEFGDDPGQFNSPIAIASDAAGYLYVTDEHNNRIQKFTPEGEFVTAWGEFGSEPGQLNFPFGITVDEDGYVYLTEVGLDRLQFFEPVN